MSQRLLLLADLELDDLLTGAPHAHPMLRQALIVCGLVLLATLPVVVWAAFFRKRARRRRTYHHHVHSNANASPPPAAGASALSGAPAEPGTASQSLAVFPKGPKRRRRHAHRPLNPTLAETGGLPPVRTDRPSQSSS